MATLKKRKEVIKPDLTLVPPVQAAAPGRSSPEAVQDIPTPAREQVTPYWGDKIAV